MKNRILLSAFLGTCLLGTSLFGLDQDSLSVSGTYLGGLFTYSQNAAASNQFDYATNLDFEYKISGTVTGIVQLQSGPGNGTQGFVGPGVNVTDINMVYYNADSNVYVTFGSFDTPFGNGVQYLTNNADSFNNALLNNSLMYSALAGPVGTLNTLGVMFNMPSEHLDLTAAFTNGTDETAQNTGSGVETVLKVGNKSFIPNTYVSATYITSNDQDDPNTMANTNSFQTRLNGWIFDAETSIDHFNLRGYVGNISYGDDNVNTVDDVHFMMGEITTPIKDKAKAAIRYSTWRPTDETPSNRSTDLATPGFDLYGLNTDASVDRLQLGYTYELEDNLVTKLEFFVDNYRHGKDTSGLALIFNGKF